MAVNTHQDYTLSLILNGQEIACQLIGEPQIVRPWAGQGSTTVTACGDVLSEPAQTPETGSITADVLADFTATTGVSVVLDELLGQTVDFTWVETVDTATGATRTLDGKCKVLPKTRTWRHGRYSAHDLNLEFVSEDAPPVYAPGT